MADLLLLAVSDYPGIPLDRRTVVLAVTLAVFLVVLPLAAWSVGAFDRSRTGRHAADRPAPSPWVEIRRRSMAAWLVRNEEAQRELAEARRGGGER